MAATRPISEICERYRINRSTVHKYTKQYRETGNIEPLSRKHIRTRSKLSSGDSMLLETIVQSNGSTSLKEIKSELSNFGDYGELSLSTLSRHVRKNLPSGKDYSRKRLGKCAGERFTHENLVYTQLYLDYLSFGHFFKTCSNILQTSNVWLPNMSCLHPIRTCFSVTCPRLDENDGTFTLRLSLFLFRVFLVSLSCGRLGRRKKGSAQGIKRYRKSKEDHSALTFANCKEKKLNRHSPYLHNL